MPKKAKGKKAAKKPKPVNPIPPGFHTVTPDLVVSNGSEAIEFYKKAFGAKELNRSPLPDGKIMNAMLKIGDSVVMLSDEFPGGMTRSPKSIGGTAVTIHIYSKNVDKLWAQALSAGATVTMPLDNQFWGDRYGQLSDPFGHHWSMSQRIKMSKQEMEEKQKAAMAMFSQGGQQAGSQPVAPASVAPSS
jgi:PhnB protein